MNTTLRKYEANRKAYISNEYKKRLDAYCKARDDIGEVEAIIESETNLALPLSESTTEDETNQDPPPSESIMDDFVKCIELSRLCLLSAVGTTIGMRVIRLLTN